MTASKSSSPQPVSDRRTQRQCKIVECATRLFAESGFAACDMEGVAEALGIAKGTLYLYFPGKQDLFFACVDAAMSQMIDEIQKAVQQAEKPFEKIGGAIRTYLTFFEQHPQYVELLLQERAIFKDRQRPSYFQHRDANRAPWRALYSELVACGQLRSDLAVEGMLNAVSNLVYGTMFTNYFTGRATSLDEQYEMIMRTVFQGLLSDQARADWQLPCPHGEPGKCPAKGEL